MIQSKQYVNFTFPSDKEITVSRLFDAPRELVFKVYTDPSLIVKWWGQKNMKTVVKKFHLKPGGIWKFVQRGRNDIKFVFKGVYNEVMPPERLVYTYESEVGSGHTVIETVTFDEIEGKTKLTDKLFFNTVEDRNRMLHAGVEAGIEETMDRFEEVMEICKDKIK